MLNLFYQIFFSTFYSFFKW